MKYLLILGILFLSLPASAAVVHPSVKQLWDEYRSTFPPLEKSQTKLPDSWYFSDNQPDADELAALTCSGKKRATATSLWYFEHRGETVPQKGKLHVITNWKGVAQCIIQVTKVEIIPFNQMTAEHARIEGEGDGSLEYWKNAHKDYFPRELIPTGRHFTETMPVVFEQFQVVWAKHKEKKILTVLEPNGSRVNDYISSIAMKSCVNGEAGCFPSDTEKYFYDRNNTRFQLVKSVPGENILNWFFLPGGPGVDSKYLLELINNMKVPGNYWLIDLVGNGTNDQYKNISSETFKKWDVFLVDALEQFKNPVLVGHSFGGYLPLFCPKLEHVLKGLVILNSTPTLQSDIFSQTASKHQLPSLSEAQTLFVEKKTLGTLQALYLLEASYFFAPRDRDRGIQQIIKKLEFSILAEYWWYTQGAQFYKEITWVPQKTPTLIIGGSHDYITPLSLFEKDIRFKRKNIEVLLIKEAGHFPWLEQSYLLNKSLEQFSEKLR